jgi:hypothetical protein
MTWGVDCPGEQRAAPKDGPLFLAFPLIYALIAMPSTAP